MNQAFGIRHEDKYALERRVAITPADLSRLIREESLQAVVQSSPKRIFTDDEYRDAGAMVEEQLQGVPVVFGVKEMPADFFEEGKTYVFFSHVIKGQQYNMPMLQRLLDLRCNLIEYERIADDMGRRLIFFGRHAGLAGMINTLWALGERLRVKGYDTPFLNIRQAHTYASLDDARRDVIQAGLQIASKGLPEELSPMVIGFTGYGNVSQGAQEIAGLLPIAEVDPGDLPLLTRRKDLPTNVLFKAVFKEHHLSEPLNPRHAFDLDDYYRNPQYYRSAFDKYIPHLSVLVNGMYWDSRYPKLITREQLQLMYFDSEPRMQVIGDITCDVNGSVESTVKAATIEDPVFVYDPFTHEIISGFEGKGMQMMTVDILPSELPRESSEHFSRSLAPYVKAIVTADYSRPFEELTLPPAIRRALIVHQGRLTPAYAYLEKYL